VAAYKAEVGGSFLGRALEWSSTWLNLPRSATVVSDLPSTPYSDEDIDALCAAAIAEPDRIHSANTLVYPTGELKRGALRRRHIANTFSENATGGLGLRPPHRVTPMQRMLRRFAKKFVATRDFKSYYHQFTVRPGRFTFVTKAGAGYTLTRMPMGHTDAAFVAHMTTLALVQLAITRARASTTVYDVIIDDVAFGADTEDELRRVLKEFDHACETMCVTVGSSTDPSKTLDHRGIIADTDTGDVSFRQQFIDKHTSRRATLRQKTTAARLASIAGTIVYAAQLRHDLAERVPHILRTVAQVARLDTRAHRDIALAAILPVYDTLLTNPKWRLPVTTDVQGGYLFTDATPRNYGAIYVDPNGHVTTIHGDFRQWTSDPTVEIGAAEAIATIEGMRRLLQPSSLVRSLFVNVDNQAWWHVLQKLWVMSHLHQYKVLFDAECERLRIRPVLVWIPTAIMPADHPARLRSVPEGAVDTAIAYVDRAVSQGRGATTDGGAGGIGRRHELLVNR
jgi:hypothetical protein